MDLLIIPVLLGLGGGLIYLGANGVPQLSGLNGEPFKLNNWMKTRTSAGRPPATRGRPTSHDTELVELMNEMIQVREELSGLKERMATKPAVAQNQQSHRRPTRKTTTPLKVKPATITQAKSKLPLPAKSEAAPAPARREAMPHANRRYVRAH